MSKANIGLFGILVAAALSVNAPASATTGDAGAAIDEDGRFVFAHVESDAALESAGLLDDEAPDVMRVAVNFICPPMPPPPSPPPPPPPPPPNPN